MSMKPAKRIIHLMFKYRLWPGIIYLTKVFGECTNFNKMYNFYNIQMARRPKIMRYYNSLAIFILILDQLVKWFQSQFYTQHAWILHFVNLFVVLTVIIIM
jgi:hypothetical protein